MDIKTNKDFLIIQEHHPHLSKKIEWTWGYEIFYTFFDRLMADTRGGTRQGFKKEVSEAFMSLYELHNDMFPNSVGVTNDLWDDNSRFGSL